MESNILIGAAVWLISLLGPLSLLPRRRELVPQLELALGLALSMAVLWLFNFAVYVFFLPRVLQLFFFVGAAFTLLIKRRHLAELFKGCFPTYTAAFYVAALALGFGLLCSVKSFSGADWYGDWYEHFERTLFFLEHRPLSTTFLLDLRYPLSARPPLMHILIAYCMSFSGKSFVDYQILAFLFNSLALCGLLAVGAVIGAVPGLVLLLVSLNPMFQQNLSYGWPRLLTAFFVMTAMAAVLSRRQIQKSVIFSVLALGLITHYSAAPYLLVLAGAHLLKQRGAAFRDFIPAAILTLPWWLWSAWAFGIGETFLSNTTVTQSRHLGFGSNLGKICWHLISTFFPIWIFKPDGISLTSPYLLIRDLTFKLYQQNLPMGLGLGGLSIAVLALPRLGAYRDEHPVKFRQRSWFVGTVIVLGILVVGGYEHFGVAHACLQPVILGAIPFLAREIKHLSSKARLLISAAYLCDLGLGILLHFGLQSVPYQNGNFILKQKMHLEFLGDYNTTPTVPL